MAYKVKGALVISNKPDGSHLYLYADAVLPDYVSAGEIKRLTVLGLVEKVPDAEASASTPAAESN